MTIKKRLFWSNIYMILVPVLATLMVGLVCVGFIWLALIRGVGFGIHDQEEFDLACEVIAEETEWKLGTTESLDKIEALLDSNHIMMQIYEERKLTYSYGDSDESDKMLRAAIDRLGGNATITQNGRAMYVCRSTKNGTDYSIYLSGNFLSIRTYANLKNAIILSAVLIAITIFLSIRLTNRFLTKFVLRRIEEPLDILANGVHELKCGALDYRITYDRKDEFAPVCEDFNEMAEQLRLSMEKIKKQEQSRKELIAGISHDIRSPLTSIQAYVEGLIDGVARTPEKQQLYLQTIKRKAEDLSHMVSQLFLFSKMELGEYIEHPMMIRLDDILEKTVTGLESEYAEKGLYITMELEPVTINADSVQIERIITNILGNSLKYKSQQRGHANIRLTKEQAQCVLTFSDDGPGVPQAALPHLFEVFYRSDPARVNPDKGSGLGLAIVANAVEHMGGTVKAENKADGGLAIMITIPTCSQEGER